MPTSTHRFLAAAVLLLAVPQARAQDVAAKRTEGRYFVELAEIMLNTEDFDVVIGSRDEGGPRAGAPAQRLVGEYPRNELGTPKVTIGLNRPTGKSTFSLSYHEFDLIDRRIPQNFDGEEGVIFTSTLLPAGVVFQRQAQPPSSRSNSIDDDFIPNWGNEYGYRMRLDFKSGNFTYERNVWENERVRLRWAGGLQYAQLDQQIEAALTFAKEAAITDPISIRTREAQDLAFMSTKVQTSGFGPKLGLDARWLLGENKKWSIEADAEIAFLPENSTARYGISFSDDSSELNVVQIDSNGDTVVDQVFIQTVTEGPVFPGVAPIDFPFSTRVRQTDFTDMTRLWQGRIGFRYKASQYFTIGLDAWTMTWEDVLSARQFVKLINDNATSQIRLNPDGADPELNTNQSLLFVPRLKRREDVTFDGVSLNLHFQF